VWRPRTSPTSSEGSGLPLPTTLKRFGVPLRVPASGSYPMALSSGRLFPSSRRLIAPGVPVRWVSAEDLSSWANRTDGPVSLPTLLAYLIRAPHGSAVQLRFPSDEGVRHPGWDGRTSTETGSVYVPKGDAGWEIGAQRVNILQKACDDYQKRTAEPAPLDPASSAYVFVTPRHWPKKDEWAEALSSGRLFPSSRRLIALGCRSDG
jgi:hypothetical protein